MILSRGSIAHAPPFRPTTQRCWTNLRFYIHPSSGGNHCNLEDNADLFVMVKYKLVHYSKFLLSTGSHTNSHDCGWTEALLQQLQGMYVIQPSFFLSQHTKLAVFGFAPALTRHNFSISPWNSFAKPVRFWLAPAQVWHRIRLKVYEVKSSLIRNVLISSL